jgi:hypothetical protein
MGLPLTTVIITLPSLSCRAAPLLSRYFFLRAFLQSHDPRGPAGLESLGVTHCAPSPQAQPGRQAARPDAQTVAVAGDVCGSGVWRLWNGWRFSQSSRSSAGRSSFNL